MKPIGTLGYVQDESHHRAPTAETYDGLAGSFPGCEELFGDLEGAALARHREEGVVEAACRACRVELVWG